MIRVPQGRLHIVKDGCPHGDFRRVHGTFSQDGDEAHVLTIQDAAAGALFPMRPGVTLYGLRMARQIEDFHFTHPYRARVHCFMDMNTFPMDRPALVPFFDRSLQQFQVTRIFRIFRFLRHDLNRAVEFEIDSFSK